MCVCVCVRLSVRVVKHMSCMCGLCVCVWTHATVSVLMLPQSETSQAIPQKPQHCLVNTGTHTHTCKWHTHRPTVTPCSPVNSLQCFLSLLCRHKPKRQCCVQLIPLFRLRWQSRDRVRPDGATVVCARAWLLLSPPLRTSTSPPHPPTPHRRISECVCVVTPPRPVCLACFLVVLPPWLGSNAATLTTSQWPHKKK